MVQVKFSWYCRLTGGFQAVCILSEKQPLQRRILPFLKSVLQRSVLQRNLKRNFKCLWKCYVHIPEPGTSVCFWRREWRSSRDAGTTERSGAPETHRVPQSIQFTWISPWAGSRNSRQTEAPLPACWSVFTTSSLGRPTGRVCVQRHAILVWAHCYCFSHLLAIFFFWDFSRRKKMETNVFPAHGWTAAAPPQPLGSDNAPRNPVQFISVRLAINKVCVAFQGQGLPDSPSILSEGQTLVIKWRS